MASDDTKITYASGKRPAPRAEAKPVITKAQAREIEKGATDAMKKAADGMTEAQKDTQRESPERGLKSMFSGREKPTAVMIPPLPPLTPSVSQTKAEPPTLAVPVQLVVQPSSKILLTPAEKLKEAFEEALKKGDATEFRKFVQENQTLIRGEYIDILTFEQLVRDGFSRLRDDHNNSSVVVSTKIMINELRARKPGNTLKFYNQLIELAGSPLTENVKEICWNESVIYALGRGDKKGLEDLKASNPAEFDKYVTLRYLNGAGKEIKSIAAESGITFPRYMKGSIDGQDLKLKIESVQSFHEKYERIMSSHTISESTKNEVKTIYKRYETGMVKYFQAVEKDQDPDIQKIYNKVKGTKGFDQEKYSEELENIDPQITAKDKKQVEDIGKEILNEKPYASNVNTAIQNIDLYFRAFEKDPEKLATDLGIKDLKVKTNATNKNLHDLTLEQVGVLLGKVIERDVSLQGQLRNGGLSEDQKDKLRTEIADNILIKSMLNISGKPTSELLNEAKVIGVDINQALKEAELVHKGTSGRGAIPGILEKIQLRETANKILSPIEDRILLGGFYTPVMMYALTFELDRDPFVPNVNSEVNVAKVEEPISAAPSLNVTSPVSPAPIMEQKQVVPSVQVTVDALKSMGLVEGELDAKMLNSAAFKRLLTEDIKEVDNLVKHYKTFIPGINVQLLVGLYDEFGLGRADKSEVIKLLKANEVKNSLNEILDYISESVSLNDKSKFIMGLQGERAIEVATLFKSMGLNKGELDAKSLNSVMQDLTFMNHFKEKHPKIYDAALVLAFEKNPKLQSMENMSKLHHEACSIIEIAQKEFLKKNPSEDFISHCNEKEGVDDIVVELAKLGALGKKMSDTNLIALQCRVEADEGKIYKHNAGVLSKNTAAYLAEINASSSLVRTTAGSGAKIINLGEVVENLKSSLGKKEGEGIER